MNPFFHITREAFMQKVDALDRDIPTLHGPVIRTGFAAIVASLGDAHTSIELPVSSLFPLEFYQFREGLHIILPPPGFSGMAFRKVTGIEGLPLEEIVRRLGTVISYENEAFLKAQFPYYLQMPELLYHLGILETAGILRLRLEGDSGHESTQSIPALPFRGAMEHLDTLRLNTPEDSLPLYRRRPTEPFWTDLSGDANTVWFKYNACRDSGESSFADFSRELSSALRTRAPAKFVFDLRDNGGGDSSLLDDLIDRLVKNRPFMENTRVFLVIGRRTFSSAVLNAFRIRAVFNAEVIGENSGGKPNSYGETGRFLLRHSGLTVSFSTRFYRLLDGQDPLSMEPGRMLELSIADFRQNRDPCQEYVDSIS